MNELIKQVKYQNINQNISLWLSCDSVPSIFSNKMWKPQCLSLRCKENRTFEEKIKIMGIFKTNLQQKNRKTLFFYNTNKHYITKTWLPMLDYQLWLIFFIFYRCIWYFQLIHLWHLNWVFRWSFRTEAKRYVRCKSAPSLRHHAMIF